MDLFEEDFNDLYDCLSLTSESDDDEADRADRDEADRADRPLPFLSNPPKGHKLLVYKYDSLDALMGELNAFAASAHFSVVKRRPSNYVPGFGPTRVDI